ncbi:MAG TPA: phage tail tip lysozyme [Verrucomicrobiae bacterium]|nr:phage tail tip lysozyme [Verrucomicrobiae bacterium]
MQTVAAISQGQASLFQQNINYFNENACNSGSSGSGSSATASDAANGLVPDDQLPGSGNRSKIWNYLIGQGWTDVQAAGIMGNIAVEGVWDPESIEDPGGRGKDPSGLLESNQGYGLVGFTPGDSLLTPHQPAASGAPFWPDWTVQGKSPIKPTLDNVYWISTQLSVVYYYMKYADDPQTGKNEMQEYLNQATDARSAADAFMVIFENPGVYHDNRREDAAAKALQDFGDQRGGAGGPTSGPSGSASGSSGSGCCDTGSTGPGDSIPAGTLPSFIPEPYNGAFTQAGNKYKVAPALIAALFSEENGLEGNPSDPVTDQLPAAWANFIKSHPNPNSGWPVSSANATGPFQFLPDTWTGLGFDISQINDLSTAAQAAAKYVASNGATTDKPESSWHDAIYDYNHAEWYVNAVLKMYEYYNSQPGATPSGGSTVVPAASGGDSGSCSCTTSASGDSTIVIDPGHSGHDISDTDPATGLYDHDWPNVPEISEVFNVAQKVEAKLKTDGYNVIMTKKNVNDDVSFRQRADIANNANAALALSIHDSHDTSWDDMYGSGDGGQVYAQVVGGYRQNSAGLGRGTSPVKFTDAGVADKSQQYSQIFADTRTKDEGHKVAVTVNSFDGRSDVDPGNLAMVQLFSKVPWVYNEVGAPSGPLSQNDQDKYAQGLIDSVEKAIPLSGSAAGAAAGAAGAATPTPTAPDGTDDIDASGCGAEPGNVVQTALNLAWPEPFADRDPSKEKDRDSELTPRASYKQAMQQFNKPGFSLTGGLGTDCGVFVATVMRASGVDSDYPVSGTLAQAQYVISHPDKYDVTFPATDTSQLQPGDILILNAGTTKNASGGIVLPGGIDPTGGHTFIYVGKQQGGYNEASASFESRSANLDNTVLSDGRGSYMIARVK